MSTIIGPGAGNYGWKDVYIPAGSSQSYINQVVQNASSYKPPATTVKTTSNNTSNNAVNTGLSNINQTASEGNALIDQDYNDAMSMLSGQENVLRGQGEAAQGEIILFVQCAFPESVSK